MHSQHWPFPRQIVTLTHSPEAPSWALATPGAEFEIEDWFDLLFGHSWTQADGNPAAMQYGMRTGMAGVGVIPWDDEVLYGKIAGSGVLVHVSEFDAGLVYQRAEEERAVESIRRSSP